MCRRSFMCQPLLLLLLRYSYRFVVRVVESDGHIKNHVCHAYWMLVVTFLFSLFPFTFAMSVNQCVFYPRLMIIFAIERIKHEHQMCRREKKNPSSRSLIRETHAYILYMQIKLQHTHTHTKSPMPLWAHKRNTRTELWIYSSIRCCCCCCCCCGECAYHYKKVEKKKSVISSRDGRKKNKEKKTCEE